MIQFNRLQGLPGRLIVLALLLDATPASAEVEFIQDLFELGKDFAEWLDSLVPGEPIDRKRALDFEGGFLDLQNRLEARSRSDSQNRRILQQQIDTVRSDLAMLKTVLNGVPAPPVLELFKSKVRQDLELMRADLEAHGKELGEHSILLEDHRQRIEELERARVSASVPKSADPSESREPSSYRPAFKSPKPITSRSSQYSGGGVTLVINISGGSNRIRLRSVGTVQGADLGTFEVVASGQVVEFSLLSGTSSVITIDGMSNIIELTPVLCGPRVRIRDLTHSNSMSGCPPP